MARETGDRRLATGDATGHWVSNGLGARRAQTLVHSINGREGLEAGGWNVDADADAGRDWEPGWDSERRRWTVGRGCVGRGHGCRPLPSRLFDADDTGCV